MTLTFYCGSIVVDLFLFSLFHRYIGDGRFHLEAIMIANPSVPAFKYDPYSKKITKETYNHREMESFRRNAITLAKSTIPTTTIQSEVACQTASVWGIVL